MKILLTILGALIGPFAGFFGMLWLTTTFPDRGNSMWIFEAIGQSFLVGIPLGTITFCLLGLWLGSYLDNKAKGGQPNQEHSDSGAESGTDSQSPL